MNPQNHLLVRFLRFLNFNNVADQYVNYLLGGNDVDVHPDILEAADMIVKRMAIRPANFLQNPNDRIVFQRVAEQFDLFNLPTGLAQPANNHLNI
ncbi:Uncharacterised protein [Legionella lansingensis]|uniref:Uncharacterized protein n=1 Tax=Legionella lansingensis TaxID=45067 RepID=A0A0W0VLG4_9GAMM|nr:hypothetical protein [Legionella lansingensis]KTD20991.1 hypothetical protein Llan_1721 [Legionella lansingensis]SNV44816.1 Uncharacterised protein [Legionella lansingensis]